MQAEPMRDDRRIKLAGMRAMIARKMQQSLQQSAQLTLFATADAIGLLALRVRLKADGAAATVEDLFVWAFVRTLERHKQLNARLEGDEIVQSNAVHVAIAVDLPAGGLVAPAIADADRLSLAQLAASRADLVARARQSKLSVAEMTGGTVTVSNLGQSRVTHFTPILNAPQVAILGLGRVVSAQAPLSLTFDHRALDGAAAAAALTSLVELIESMGADFSIE